MAQFSRLGTLEFMRLIKDYSMLFIIHHSSIFKSIVLKVDATKSMILSFRYLVIRYEGIELVDSAHS